MDRWIAVISRSSDDSSKRLLRKHHCSNCQLLYKWPQLRAIVISHNDCLGWARLRREHDLIFGDPELLDINPLVLDFLVALLKIGLVVFVERKRLWRRGHAVCRADAQLFDNFDFHMIAIIVRESQGLTQCQLCFTL